VGAASPLLPLGGLGVWHGARPLQRGARAKRRRGALLTTRIAQPLDTHQPVAPSGAPMRFAATAEAVSAAALPAASRVAAAAATLSAAAADALSTACARAAASGDAHARIAAGLALGAAGAGVVAVGGGAFVAATLFITYHAAREYFGMLSARAAAGRGDAPAPIVAAATSGLSLALVAAAALGPPGAAGAAVSVAAFAVLGLHVFTQRPSFSQMTSSLYGLLYCGGCRVPPQTGRGARCAGSAAAPPGFQHARAGWGLQAAAGPQHQQGWHPRRRAQPSNLLVLPRCACQATSRAFG
jgi:hypothetical protein